MPPSPDLPLIAEIKKAISDAGLPVTELAARVEISHSQLSSFIRGKRSLTLPTAAKLFDRLGLRVVRPARSPLLSAPATPSPAPAPARKPARRKPG